MLKISGSISRRLFVTAFLLNWIWEGGQMFAFRVAWTWWACFFYCTLATVVDALATLIIFLLLTGFSTPPDKNFRMSKTVLANAALLGAICAIAFEQLAFTYNLWAYNELMPTLPILGTGLLPFLQLTILIPLAIWLVHKTIEIRWHECGTTSKN